MTVNQLIFQILLLFGLLLISMIILLITIFKEFKEKSGENLILSLLIGVVIIIILTVIMGMAQEL